MGWIYLESYCSLKGIYRCIFDPLLGRRNVRFAFFRGGTISEISSRRVLLLHDLGLREGVPGTSLPHATKWVNENVYPENKPLLVETPNATWPVLHRVESGMKKCVKNLLSRITIIDFYRLNYYKLPHKHKNEFQSFQTVSLQNSFLGTSWY